MKNTIKNLLLSTFAVLGLCISFSMNAKAADDVESSTTGETSFYVNPILLWSGNFNESFGYDKDNFTYVMQYDSEDCVNVDVKTWTIEDSEALVSFGTSIETYTDTTKLSYGLLKMSLDNNGYLKCAYAAYIPVSVSCIEVYYEPVPVRVFEFSVDDIRPIYESHKECLDSLTKLKLETISNFLDITVE